ncbi:MAG: peptidoglycan-binding domain-containing protein, partial [Chloroflexota bacterium]
LPALAHLKIGDRSDWTLIAGLGLESYTVVSANGERAELSRESLRAAYQDHALFLWVDPSRDAGELARYAAGDDVRALQQILSVLGLLQGAQLGNFDAETETVIRGIQRATGLKIDGIAGRQTRMVLTNWLESWPGPSLTSESFSPDVARRVQDAIAQERGAP